MSRMNIENAPRRRLVKLVANQNDLEALLKAKRPWPNFLLHILGWAWSLFLWKEAAQKLLFLCRTKGLVFASSLPCAPNLSLQAMQCILNHHFPRCYLLMMSILLIMILYALVPTAADNILL